MKRLMLLTIVAVGASGYLFKLPILPATPKTDNSDWIHRQKLILALFENVCDISTDPAIVLMAQDFSLDTTTGKFEDPNVIIRLKELISNGLLPKGEIFTEYNPDHVKELEVVIKVLITAQDFHTFYTAASWMRQNVNCGLFVDALYLAITERKDTKKLSIPAPYELMPNYFVNKEAIVIGSSLMSNIPNDFDDKVRNDGNAYIIDANYTSDIYDNDDESKLAYFHEDVGLNTYYFIKKLSIISRAKDVAGIDRYGEYVYHVIKQLATRYDLERYANGFDEVGCIDWNSPDSRLYDPMLIYSNGQDFDTRTENTHVDTSQDIAYLQNIETSIATVVNHMIQNGSDKVQILNNLIEILLTGDKNYEDTAHRLLGTDINDIKKTPTVLDHFMTSLRDPMFWKLNKKIVNIIEDALSIIPTYSRNEIYFPGVKITNVEIKKMSTNFDTFEFDVTDALKPLEGDSSFQIKISQPRLNHKSFAIKVNITSLVAQKGLMKIFVGPKLLPGDLALNKDKFMLIDTCEITLKKGGNIITKTSDELSNISPDFLTLKALHQNVEDAEFGIGNLPLENIQKLTGFPSRLIIPKGTEEGLPLQIFVFIAPFAKVNIATAVAEFNSAILSPGYPLDLTVNDKQVFDLPNSIVKEVLVTHKASSGSKYEIGKGKKWDGETYDYTASKGPYNYGDKRQFGIDHSTEETIVIAEPRLLQMKPNRETFDYKSKKQYSKRIVTDLKSTERTVPYDDKLVNTPSIQPTTRLLEKKPFYVDATKDVHKSIIDTNDTFNLNIGKNKDFTKTLEANIFNKAVNIKEEMNKNVVPGNVNNEKSFDITIDSSKEKNLNTLDNSKKVDIRIDSKKDLFDAITEKKYNGEDEPLISREKIHENIEDAIGKYFTPKLKEELYSTKRVPSVYDYIVHGYDDYDVEQPVYE